VVGQFAWRDIINPSPPFRGEREGPAPKAWEGEVGVGKRSGIPHLTPTLSAPGGGEGVKAQFLAPCRTLGGLALLIALTAPTVMVAAEMPAGASSCSGCHAASAAVQTPVPRLVGVPAPQIVTAMQAFRTGQRPATVMDRIAKGFSEEEISALAAWYAAQKD
jgi:cytochrome subunit of sulfide dehydrogenase